MVDPVEELRQYFDNVAVITHYGIKYELELTKGTRIWVYSFQPDQWLLFKEGDVHVSPKCVAWPKGEEPVKFPPDPFTKPKISVDMGSKKDWTQDWTHISVMKSPTTVTITGVSPDVKPGDYLAVGAEGELVKVVDVKGSVAQVVGQMGVDGKVMVQLQPSPVFTGISAHLPVQALDISGATVGAAKAAALIQEKMKEQSFASKILGVGNPCGEVYLAESKKATFHKLTDLVKSKGDKGLAPHEKPDAFSVKKLGQVEQDAAQFKKEVMGVFGGKSADKAIFDEAKTFQKWEDQKFIEAMEEAAIAAGVPGAGVLQGTKVSIPFKKVESQPFKMEGIKTQPMTMSPSLLEEFKSFENKPISAFQKQGVAFTGAPPPAYTEIRFLAELQKHPEVAVAIEALMRALETAKKKDDEGVPADTNRFVDVS